MKKYISEIIRGNEREVNQFIKTQDMNETSDQYGLIKGEVPDVKQTVAILSGCIAGYFNKESKHYKDATLKKRMLIALSSVMGLQREEGSFDYVVCNFYSAPDTGFCMESLINCYKLIEKYDDGSEEELKETILVIIERAMNGMLAGGFHTPNHRWVISNVLASCTQIFKGQPVVDELENRIAEYLAEGIDCNSDGEYAERSNGIYNSIVNTAFINIYEVTKDEQYLEYVKRNLTTMLSYIQPDGSIFTENSTRQDNGHVSYPIRYFYQYLYLAAKYEIKEFDAIAHQLIKIAVEDRTYPVPECLPELMLNEELMEYEFKGCGFLDTYRTHLKESKVLRVKNKTYTYSIVGDKDKFLFLQAGELPIYMKIGISYCSERSFKAQEVDVTENGANLNYKAKGWYYLPFKEKQDTIDWWKMDHTKRETVNTSEVEIKVEVVEQEDGLEIAIKSEGCDRIPLRVAFGVPAESIIENEYFQINAIAGESMIVKGEDVNVHYQGQTLNIGPGFGEHQFKGHYSGEAKEENRYVLYMNGYTNIDKKIRLRIKE